MGTITKFVMVTGFGWLGWNYGVRQFVSMPHVTLYTAAGVSAVLIVGLILVGKNK